jgi:membrane protease YdiL (CAAX protease family)
MSQVAQFFWVWLLASLLLGFAMGWISVVQRSGVTGAWERTLWALVAVLLVLAMTRIIPGRFGYWLDLGLVMFGLYLIGCTVGTCLRAWVVARTTPPA